MDDFYKNLTNKNRYRHLRHEIGEAIAGYMRVNQRLLVDKVYAGFHTDLGYVVFENSPRRHRVRMTYDWLVASDSIVIKIVFQDPKVVKCPIQIKIVKPSVGNAAFGLLRTYIILRQSGDEEAALDFISYKKDNDANQLKISTRLLAKRNLTNVLSGMLNKATPNQEVQYFLDRDYNIYRVGQDNKPYVFALSTYTDLIDGKVIIKLESEDVNDPNRIIMLSIGQNLLTLFKVYSDYVYADAMGDQTNH